MSSAASASGISGNASSESSSSANPIPNQASQFSTEEGVDSQNGDTENEHDHGDNDDDSIQNIPGFTEEDERRELASLSMKDITEVQSDLCGFSSVFSSSCNLAQHALVGPNLPAAIANLNHEMSRLPSVETAAYYRAVEACPDQVRPERKLLFLEYANGNAQEAARALAEYWQGRLDLFGLDKTFRPMTLTGALKEDAMTMMQRQVVQLVPVMDTAGRAILFFSPSRRRLNEYTIEQELQAVWYLFEVVLENPGLRKNGVVVICDLRGVQRRHIRRVTRYVRVWQTLDSCLPLDIRGMHCCYPTSAFYYLIFPVVKRLASKSIRLRLKLHYGDDNSVLNNLAGFCLTRDRLPTEFGGDIRLDMKQWMLNRISLEAARSSLEGASVSNDPAVVAAAAVIAAAPPASSTMSSQQEVKIDGVIPSATHLAGPTSTILSSTQAIPIPLVASTKQAGKQAAQKGRAPPPSKSASNQKPKVVKKRKKETRGRKPDKQMNLAVQFKLSNPDMPHKDALLAAGYVFQRVAGKTDLVDQTGVSLSQRRNNLCRRIRIGKAKMKRDQGAEDDDDDEEEEEEEEIQSDGSSDGNETEKANKGIQQQPQDPPNNDESTAAQSLLNLMRKPSAV